MQVDLGAPTEPHPLLSTSVFQSSLRRHCLRNGYVFAITVSEKAVITQTLNAAARLHHQMLTIATFSESPSTVVIYAHLTYI